MNLRHIAAAFGGGNILPPNSILVPGPNHSARDRSLHVTFTPQAIDGFVICSYSGDDFAACRDWVKTKLGMDANRRPFDAARSLSAHSSDDASRISAARRLIDEAKDWRGTVVERYLRDVRGLTVDDTVADLGFHPACPWRCEETGNTIRVPAMIATMRSIETEEVVAAHRTRLTPDSQKVGRRMLGKASGAAIMLCPFSAVGAGLTVAEGIETALAGWSLGWSNVWAMGSAGGVASLPVINGIQSLVVLAEDDDANRRAVGAVASRYDDAGREVLTIHARGGGDMNDVIVREARCA